MGEYEIDDPQDRDSSFEPRGVKRREKDSSEIEEKIINMYGLGMSNRDITSQIEDIYGFELSEGMISDVTDKIIPKIENGNIDLLKVCILLYI